MRSMATALILAAGMATAATSPADTDDLDHDLTRTGDVIPLSAILKRLESLGYHHISDVGYIGGLYAVSGRRTDGSSFALDIDARTGEIRI